MKKLFLALLVLLVLTLGAIYIFIPRTLVIRESVAIPCNRDAAFRTMTVDTNWRSITTANPYLSTASFQITKRLSSGFTIAIQQPNTSLSSDMVLIPYGKDTTLIEWQCSMQAGSNPLQRIAAYRTAVTIKNNMDSLCSAIKNRLSDFENVYGFRLQEASTIDTLLITARSMVAAYPGTDTVYALVHRLKTFAAKTGCTVTGNPMLNITRIDSNRYQVMAALPVDRVVTGKDGITPSKMVPGRFIVTDVKGGMQTVEYTLQQIRYYFQDYGRTSMAIPFCYLVTDRQIEPDTTRWVTRIYAPVY